MYGRIFDARLYRWAAYTRASTDEQIHSRDRQMESIGKWAEAHEAFVYYNFDDTGTSGTVSLADRSEGAALLDYVKHRAVTAIVIDELSRLGRDPLDVEHTMWVLQRDYDCRVFVVRLNVFVDMTNLVDFILIRSINTAGYVEVLKRREQIKAGWDLKKKRGNVVANPKMYYNRITNDEGEQFEEPDMSKLHDVETVFRGLMDGASCWSISKDVGIDVKTVQSIRDKWKTYRNSFKLHQYTMHSKHEAERKKRKKR